MCEGLWVRVGGGVCGGVGVRVSVCTFKTRLCVPSKTPARLCFQYTYGDVVSAHTSRSTVNTTQHTTPLAARSTTTPSPSPSPPLTPPHHASAVGCANSGSPAGFCSDLLCDVEVFFLSKLSLVCVSLHDSQRLGRCLRVGKSLVRAARRIGR